MQGASPLSIGLSDAGKGDGRRPSQIGSEEEALRYALAEGKITREQFLREYTTLLHEGKVTRSGRVIRPTPEE